MYILVVVAEGNIHEISKFVRRKIKKKYTSKKIIIQNNIYVAQQFAYVHRVVMISLFTRKITKCGSTILSLSLSLSLSKQLTKL